MKKSELKSLIKECVGEILREEYTPPKVDWNKIRENGHYGTEEKVDLPDGKYECLRYGYVLEIPVGGKHYKTFSGVRCGREMTSPNQCVVKSGRVYGPNGER